MNPEKIKNHASKLPFGSVIYTVVVTTVALVLIAAGIAMLVLPGPGILVILLGLGLLGTEFPWAKRLLEKIHALAKPWIDRAKAWWKSRKRPSVP